MANLTLLDIAKMKGNDSMVPLIEESIVGHPETALLPARTIRGTSYTTLIREALPTAAFRNANEGVAAVTSRYGQKLVQTFILEQPVETDKAVADAHEDGWQAVMAQEAQAQLESVWRLLGSQLFYGVSNDAKGFPGLVATVDAAMVVDVGGAGADTSSVWALKLGEGWITWVLGNGGSFEVTDPEITRITDGAGNPLTAYRQVILCYPGVQLANKYAMARCKNVDSVGAGVTLVDADLYQMLDLFPAGVQPDIILMSRRSRRQLRESRTATNATGAPAPMPTDFEGIPIYVTDSILDTETAA